MSTLCQNPKDADFDAEYPGVYAMFCEYAAAALSTGATKIGGKQICERIRWERMFSRGERTFKINNSDTAYLVRRWIRDHPEQASVFELRKSREDAA